MSTHTGDYHTRQLRIRLPEGLAAQLERYPAPVRSRLVSLCVRQSLGEINIPAMVQAIPDLARLGNLLARSLTALDGGERERAKDVIAYLEKVRGAR
jgi:hypothetical protein